MPDSIGLFIFWVAIWVAIWVAKCVFNLMDYRIKSALKYEAGDDLGCMPYLLGFKKKYDRTAKGKQWTRRCAQTAIIETRLWGLGIGPACSPVFFIKSNSCRNDLPNRFHPPIITNALGRA